MSVTNLESSQKLVKFKDDFLRRYLLEAPIPLAVERSLECAIMSEQEFRRPVLDIGCGEGLFAEILFDEKIDLGIDPNAKEIERARQYGMYKNHITCLGNEIPKEDASFNTVFSNSVLEHIEDILPVLKEAHRLLTDEGRFFVTVPTHRFDKYSVGYRFLRFCQLEALAEKFRLFYNRFWKHYHYFDRDGWSALFDQAGFEVEASKEYGSRKICTFNDAMVPFAFFSCIIKRTVNRWIISKNFRKFYIGPVYAALKHFVHNYEGGKEGGLIFFALRKKK